MLKKLSIFLSIISLLIFPLVITKVIDVKAFMDFTVFIDPGHGGKDNGASYLSVYEDEINLNVSSKLYEKCINRNFFAYLSRTNDYDLASLYAKNRKQEDLKKRIEYISHSGCDIYISIHMNTYQANDVYGPMVYYKKSDDKSYLLAKCVQKQLNILTNLDKKVHTNDFYLFRKCEKVGILIECGFLSNENERNKLLTDEYQDSLADSIYEGIYQYYLNK